MTSEELAMRCERLNTKARGILDTARALPLTASPRESALVMKMVIDHDNDIFFLQLDSGATIAFSRVEKVGEFACPRMINVRQTLLNLKNGR